MNKKYIYIISLCIIATLSLLLFSSDKSSSVDISFYHWKNSYQLDNTQLKQAHAKHIYIKFLDIAYSDKLEVIATRFIKPAPANAIPVVYIDNQVLKHGLVDKLYHLIKQKINPAKYTQLQLDCDWSLMTKTRYFTLLRRLKRDYGELSATIRLHQIKYFKKTGVPPVSKGVLMYYNMSNIQDITIKNYILDVDTAKKYHVNFEQYPLPLDLALPLYSQVRVIRQHKVVTVLSDKILDQSQLKPLTDNKFEVIQAHYLQSNYLYKNDILVIDQVTQDDLLTAAKGLRLLIQPKEIIFYDFNHAKNFTYETLESIAHLFN